MCALYAALLDCGLFEFISKDMYPSSVKSPEKNISEEPFKEGYISLPSVKSP